MPSKNPSEKKVRAQKNGDPSQSGTNKRIAQAISALDHTLANKADAACTEDRREDTGNKWLQGLTLGFVVLTTVGIFWQARILNNTDRTLRESMIGSQRAWIGTPEIKIEKISNSVVKFIFFFKNVGHTPTHGLYIDANISSEGGIFAVNELCQKGERVAKTNQDFFLWSSIPNDVFPISKMPAKDFTTIDLSSLKNVIVPTIVGCVIYGDRIDNALHRTGFIAPIDLSGDSINVSYVWAMNPN